MPTSPKTIWPIPTRCRRDDRAFPDADAESLSDAIWALVHGLAFLYVDGKFDNADPQVTDARVRAAVHAVTNLRN